MSVRKRKWTTRKGEAKQSWIVDYLLDGKRHVETFDRKRQAEAYERKVRLDIDKGMHVPTSASKTVAEAAQDWLSQCSSNGLERSTIRQYQQHVKHHIAPRLGNIKLAKLTPQMLKGFRNQLIGDDNGNGEQGYNVTLALSRPLARKVLISLKSLLRNAEYSHVAADVKIKSGKREHRLEAGTDFPEAGEIKRLIEAAKAPRQRALLLTAALTGLRASELRGLRWKDVRLDHGTLTVNQRADRFNKIGPPKSKAGTRTIPLAPEVIEALKRWKPACPTKADARGDDRLVFPTSTGHFEHHSNMLRGLAPIMIAARVVDDDGAPKYAMHAFRHFFASWCINPKNRGGRELPPKVVQHLLGHSSIVMTLDVYGHLFPNPEDREELAQATAALLGGPPTGKLLGLPK
jgi:integrase